MLDESNLPIDPLKVGRLVVGFPNCLYHIARRCGQRNGSQAKWAREVYEARLGLQPARSAKISRHLGVRASSVEAFLAACLLPGSK